MVDSGDRKRKLQESNSEIESRTAKRGTLSESQQSDSTLKPAGEDGESSETDEIFKSVLATLPPVQQWSSATIESLRSAINEKYPKSEWQEESEWTRKAINAILESNEGWNWQRLKICSNADYFSLPTQTIALLNALFYASCLDTVKASREAGDFRSSLDLKPTSRGSVGYPIFRVDYSSDEKFELYKTCWDQFMEKEFYMPEAVDRKDVTWHWVDDKAKLDGKRPRDVQELFRSLFGSTSPYGLSTLWLCLMVDRTAIESMLRVYGPPATLVFTVMPSGWRKDIPFLPYVTAVDTDWTEEENGNGESDNEAQDGVGINDGEYHGHFKCALESIFLLWQNEQSIAPDEYYPRNGSVWGDIGFEYYPPTAS